MSRIWKEQQPGDPLIPKWAYFVRVCGFTFQFASVKQIRDYLAFYSQKIHPTSRLPDRQWIEDEARRDPGRARKRIDAFIGAEHDCMQRWWERLPLYLQEEPKRQRVVTALEEAIREFDASPTPAKR
jgi:hypothetical protein